MRFVFHSFFTLTLSISCPTIIIITIIILGDLRVGFPSEGLEGFCHVS